MFTTLIPVILDTDLGDDIDDTWALAMLLASPEVDLLLITTAFADVDKKASLVAKILERTGRPDVPIGIGVSTEGRPLNQEEWLSGYSRRDYRGIVHTDGVGALIDVVLAAKERVTICVIGPQTNIAEALRRAPSIADKAQIVAMAGSIHTNYHGQEGRVPEWNVMGDLEAARAVFAAPWDITLAPLDITCSLMLGGERYRRVEESTSPLATVVMENYALWAHRTDYPANQSSVLHDTVAAYLTHADACVELETLKLVIDDQGNTVPSSQGRPVRCAMRWRNRPAFEDAVVDRVTKTAPAGGGKPSRPRPAVAADGVSRAEE